jgi:hypothetical protein
MKKIFSSSGHHSVLPYMGIYLRDLTFIEDGNVNFDEKGKKIISLFSYFFLRECEF